MIGQFIDGSIANKPENDNLGKWTLTSLVFFHNSNKNTNQEYNKKITQSLKSHWQSLSSAPSLVFVTADNLHITLGRFFFLIVYDATLLICPPARDSLCSSMAGGWCNWELSVFAWRPKTVINTGQNHV